jgi:hypothetical protein
MHLKGIFHKGRSMYLVAVLGKYSPLYRRNYVLQAWHAMAVLFQGIKAVIIKQEMVLGTGQILQLDASQSQDLDRTPGVLQVICPYKY